MLLYIFQSSFMIQFSYRTLTLTHKTLWTEMVICFRHPAMFRWGGSGVSLYQRMNCIFPAQFTSQCNTRHYILPGYITLWECSSDLLRYILLHYRSSVPLHYSLYQRRVSLSITFLSSLIYSVTFCYIAVKLIVLRDYITLHYSLYQRRVCGVSRSIPTFRLHCPILSATHLLP